MTVAFPKPTPRSRPSKPLRRRKPMRRGPGRTKYARRPREFGRMIFVKSLYCWVGEVYGSEACSRVVEAHHAGQRGLGQKATDDTCVPLCVRHHRQVTDRNGFFAPSLFSRDELRAWSEGAIAAARERWDALTNAERASWDARARGTPRT